MVFYIPNDRVGDLEKRWSVKGSVKSGFIALEGEAGYQPELLRGGLHYLMPLQYRVHRLPLVTIPQGKIGYVFARDGAAARADADAGRATSRAARVPGRRGQFLRERRPARPAAQDPA